MRILIDIGHPANVHFFKHFIRIMQEKGHQISITAREKDVASKLLDAYGFRYENIGRHQKSLLTKVINVLPTDWRLYQAGRKFQPDLILGFGSINASHSSVILRKPCILFDDDEYSPWSTYFFARTMCTFHNFKKHLGKKQVIINGFKELAYLHPDYFKPDPSVLKYLGISEGDKYVIVRFVAWEASHDVGRHGFNIETKKKLINELEKYTKVFITSESPLPSEFDQYRLTTPPEKIHDLLYYATLLVGDTQTMTTEAAILGTPAVRCNSFVGPDDMGNFIELEKDYDLIYSFNQPDDAVNKAIELIRQPNLKAQWKVKREKLLNDKINVTKFMVEFIENYPGSYQY